MLNRIRGLSQRRVIRDGSWSVVGQAISAVALLAGTRVVTEMVPDPAVMGTVTLLIGIVTLVRNVFAAPVLQGQFRFYADSAARGETRRLRYVTNVMLLWTTGPLLAVLVVGGVWYAWRTGHSYLLALALAATLVVETIRTYEANFLTAARRQRVLTFVTMADSISRLAVMAWLVWVMGPTPQAVIGGYAMGTAIVYVMVWLRVNREGVHGPAGGPVRLGDPLVRELVRYALPIVPLAVVGWVTSLSDRYILELFLDTEKVGVYTMTYGLISQPFLQAHGVVSRTLMPIYYKAVSDGNQQVEARSFQAWLLGTAAIGALGFLGVLTLRYWVAGTLLSSKYRAGVSLMPWIAAGYALYCLATVFEARLYARKLTGRVLAGNAVGAAASIVAPLVFMYYWGVLGVAMACPAYFAVLMVVMALLSRVGVAGTAKGVARSAV